MNFSKIKTRTIIVIKRGVLLIVCLLRLLLNIEEVRMKLDEILKICPNNDTIKNSIVKAYHIINNPKYNKIVCSISGGADSDIMLDICYKCDVSNKVNYIWFDTGLEYSATKQHLKYLESKYGITINTIKAIKPIPTTCHEYGQPFVSKQISEYMKRLQSHNFQWEDEDFDTLYKRYPNCKAALLWWCNKKQSNCFNIRGNKWLKEFLIINHPYFKISNSCCYYAKKKLAKTYICNNEIDLHIIGIRKFEGGVRSLSYKNCFDENINGCDNYRPLFWYTNKDKEEYEKSVGIMHSKCYSEYGLKRTGCAGCPYGRNFEEELEVIKRYEPNLYKAVENIFGKSHEYTRAYKEFCKQMDEQYGSYKAYLEKTTKKGD